MNHLAQLSSYTLLHRRLFDLYQTACTARTPEGSDLYGALETIAQDSAARSDPRVAELIERYRRLLTLALKGADAADQSPDIRKSKLPVVLTSINPFSRAELQVQCLKQWKALGFEVYTLNHGAEMKALNDAGIGDSDIIQLGVEETGQDLFGKPMPRIRAVLNRAYARFDRDILIVNSDLYPAASDSSFIDIWRQSGDALALTRQEVLSIDSPVRRIWQPYRGGLDAFLLSYANLGKLRDELSLFPVSNRMCFGIVGWDYLMGALLKTRLGGTFLDSQVLLHEMHRPTYSNVDEFKHYLAAMQALGVGLYQDHTAAATEFSQQIDASCQKNLTVGGQTALQALLYKDPTPQENDPELGYLKELEKRAPQLVHAFGYSYVASATKALASRKVAFSELIIKFPDAEKKRSFSHIFLLFTLLLPVRNNEGFLITQSYPKGNKHAEAIQVIRQNTANDPDLRRLELAKLFCIELIDYGIFNPRLFNVLALSCENDAERTLLSEIKNFLTERTQDAA